MIATLILAGGKLPAELVPYAEGATNRSLIRVGPAEETMLDLVVTAVRSGLNQYRGATGRILVAGEVPLPNDCIAVAGGDSLVDTLLNGVKALRSEEDSLLLVTADAPFLTAEAIADFLVRCDAVAPTPFAYPIIEVETCLRAFPGMKRTAVRIAEGKFTGGNIALLDPGFVRSSEPAIRGAYALRKDPVGLARMLGPEIILRFVASRLIPTFLRIGDVEAAIARMLDCAMPRAIVSPFPEIGTDVDHPEDIHIARRLFRKLS